MEQQRNFLFIIILYLKLQIYICQFSYFHKVNMQNKGMILNIINPNKLLKTLRISQKWLLPMSNKKIQGKILQFGI